MYAGRSACRFKTVWARTFTTTNGFAVSVSLCHFVLLRLPLDLALARRRHYFPQWQLRVNCRSGGRFQVDTRGRLSLQVARAGGVLLRVVLDLLGFSMKSRSVVS